MTHGDKEKAKKAASKASGDKKSKAVTSAKAVQTSKSGKTGKEGGGKAVQTGKAVEAHPKAVQSKAGEKAAAPAKAGNEKPKARAVAAEPPGGFTNPVVASGFKRALKKFPNAFRRLTD